MKEMPENIYFQKGKDAFGEISLRRWQTSSFDEGTRYIRADIVDGLVEVLREFRKWMDPEIGEWDAKFIAEIEEKIANFEGKNP